MSEGLQIITSSTVKVNVSNSHSDVVSFEKKFDKGLTISDLKSKLEILTGASPATMQLELFSGSKLVCKVDNNDALLGSYHIEDGMRIHVIDNILFEQNVPKFELTSQQYETREDSLRSYLKRNKLGKYNEEEMKEIERKREEAAKRDQERAQKILIGSRCKVTTTNQPSRLGTVMYNGHLENKKGIFIGVRFDEPLGVNDGTSNGRKYFECQANYGSFVPPHLIEVGDFPEEEINFDDEI